MPDHDGIYANEPEQYHLLISRQKGLGGEIRRIRPPDGLDIVDLGAGTGRLAAELVADARTLTAVDASEAMLRICAERLARTGRGSWSTVAADYASLPLADRSADLIVAGWSICYAAASDAPGWRERLAAVMAECGRILRPGGTMIILENMGTGSETPSPPDFLIPYFESLRADYGFDSSWIRTDYQFADTGEAERLTRFFFGGWLADRVRQEGLTLVPECAGLWWRHLPADPDLT